MSNNVTRIDYQICIKFQQIKFVFLQQPTSLAPRPGPLPCFIPALRPLICLPHLQNHLTSPPSLATHGRIKLVLTSLDGTLGTSIEY